MKDSGAVSSCSVAGVCGSRQGYASRPVLAEDEPVTSVTAAPDEAAKPRTRRRRRGGPAD
jgi:hypothetical protein